MQLGRSTTPRARTVSLPQASLFTADAGGLLDFEPSSVIFKPDHRWQIIISDIGVTITLAVLAFWAYKRSLAEVAVIYGIPYLWVNK
jgi:hypothetical protein